MRQRGVGTTARKFVGVVKDPAARHDEHGRISRRASHARGVIVLFKGVKP
jgi:hypothetical protein